MRRADNHFVVRITVRFLSIARLRYGTASAELILPHDVLRNVVLEIVEKYNIRDIILADDGKIRPGARVLVNGRSQEFVGGLDTPLSDGDKLAFVYPYAEAF